MASRKQEEEAGLPRLPPGRHGLSRDYVKQNQRDRLAAGMIASVAERGYHETTISHISAAAGVSRRTFYTYFSTKEECFLDTYDLITSHLIEAGREAAGGESEWSAKVLRRVQSALATFSANPDLARYALIAPVRAGEAPLERYGRALGEAVTELTDGLPSDLDEPPAVVQQSLIGGILNLVATEVEVGRAERLEKLAPELTALFLAPYVGQAEAAKAASRA